MRFFDVENEIATPPKSPEVAVRSDLSTKKNVEHTKNFTRMFPRKFSPKRRKYVTLQIRIPIWNLIRKQAQNNQTKVRSTLAVRNINYPITQNLIALMITAISYNAALVSSAERIRRRSRNFKNALLNQYLAMQKIVKFCSGSSLATKSFTTQFTKFKTWPLILNLAKFSTYRLDSCHPLYSPFSSVLRLFDYNIITLH